MHRLIHRLQQPIGEVREFHVTAQRGGKDIQRLAGVVTGAVEAAVNEALEAMA